MDEWKGGWQSLSAGGSCSCECHGRRRPCSAPCSHCSPDSTAMLGIPVPAPNTAPSLPWDTVRQRLAFSLCKYCHCKRGYIPQEAGLGLHPLPTTLFSGTEPHFSVPCTKTFVILLNIVPCLAPGSTGTSSIPFQSRRNMLQPN